MSHRLGLRLLAVVLAVTATLAPAAAHAERVVTTDEAADVVRVDFGEGDELENSLVTPAPDTTTADITRTVVDHRARRVRVVLHYRDLEPSEFLVTALRLRTPDARFDVSMLRFRDERLTIELARRRSAVDCEGLRADLDATRETLTTTIPTACLQAPRWVRVGAGSAVLDEGGSASNAEAEPMLVDDAHLTGRIWEDSVALGPKVRRD